MLCNTTELQVAVGQAFPLATASGGLLLNHLLLVGTSPSPWPVPICSFMYQHCLLAEMVSPYLIPPPFLSQTSCRLQPYPSEQPLCQANQASLCKTHGLPSLCHINRLSPCLFSSELVFLKYGHQELRRALS